LYAEKGGKDLIAPEIASIYAANNQDFTPYINKIWDQSIFSSAEKVNAFLKNPVSGALENDQLYQLSQNIIARYQEETPEQQELDASFQKAFRLLVRGMREANRDEKYYPDANSTL